MKLVTIIFFFFYSFSANANYFQQFIKELPPTDSEERAVFFKTTDISIEEQNSINQSAQMAYGITKLANNETTALKKYDYSEASLIELSTLIDSSLPFSIPGRKLHLPRAWGAYLGNTLVKNFNGQWKKMGDGYTLAILLPNGEFIFPVNEAFKHASNGKLDSIFSVYKSVGLKMQAYQESAKEEFQITYRKPDSAEAEELEQLLKTTEISIEEEQEINQLALMAIAWMREFGHANFNYSEASVRTLNNTINEEFPFSDKALDTLPQLWGSYLGNALVKNYNGRWVKMGDGSYGVHLPDGHYFSPMNRVYKHMRNGKEDSILAFLKTVQQRNANLSKP